jgi:hypothetical protein
MTTATSTIQELATREYKHGFTTDIEVETVPRGLNEDIVRLISAKKQEPAWLLEWRLKAYRHWLTMTEPKWPNVHYPPVDFQDVIYYAAPKAKKQLSSLDEVDPELRRTFEKLGIALDEQKRLAGVAWTRCSTACRWRRRSRASWPSWASSSARSPKRSASTPSWCASTSARSCPTRITSTRP